MKKLVDRLSSELSEKYVQYLNTFMVDLWSADGFIAFRCRFALRRDHQIRSFIPKLLAMGGEKDGEPSC